MNKSSVNASIFASRLKEILNKKNINCNQLSKKSGVSRTNLCRYLQEEYAPKIGNVIKIADALNIDYCWLIGTTEIKNFQDQERAEEKIKLEKELLTDNYIFVGDLTEEQKRLMKQLVNQFRKKDSE